MLVLPKPPVLLGVTSTVFDSIQPRLTYRIGIAEHATYWNVLDRLRPVHVISQYAVRCMLDRMSRYHDVEPE